MNMADEIVNKGLNKLGYEYIIIDDCWLDHQRSPEGKLVPDPRRFPSGIKWLSDYVHSKGLKFGIYEDYGNFTCGGYPGILGHLEDHLSARSPTFFSLSRSPTYQNLLKWWQGFR